MEILGQALMDEGTLGAGEYGLWMTNWDVSGALGPFGRCAGCRVNGQPWLAHAGTQGQLTDYQPTDSTNERREHTTWHFPQDPSLDFHNYT